VQYPTDDQHLADQEVAWTVDTSACGLNMALPKMSREDTSTQFGPGSLAELCTGCGRGTDGRGDQGLVSLMHPRSELLVPRGEDPDDVGVCGVGQAKRRHQCTIR
jgi:hypothetical protein